MSAPGVQIEEAVLISGSASENDARIEDTPTRGRRVVVLALGLAVLAALCALVSFSLRGQDAVLTRYAGNDAVELSAVGEVLHCVEPNPSPVRRLLNVDIFPNYTEDEACDSLPDGTHTCVGDLTSGNCSVTITCPSDSKAVLTVCCNGVCPAVSPEPAALIAISCFPGEAVVDVAGKGLTQISTLQIGDRVLVQKRFGALRYEPVLGFLHHANAFHGMFLLVSLSSGGFRATSNHLVFIEEEGVKVSKTVGELRVGDKLFVGEVISEVRAVAEGFTKFGMFSPLTSSGTVIVDNVLASIYAQTSHLSKFPHAAAHALFFLARAYYAFMPAVFLPGQGEYMHPLAAFLHKQLHLERVLS